MAPLSRVQPPLDSRPGELERRGHRRSNGLAVIGIRAGGIEQDAVDPKRSCRPEDPSNVVGVAHSLERNEAAATQDRFKSPFVRPMRKREASSMKVEAGDLLEHMTLADEDVAGNCFEPGRERFVAGRGDGD